MSTPEVEVRRSKRRRRTVSAYRDGDKVVVLIPATMSRKQEAEWVTTMVARLERSEKRKRPSDEQLARRARELSDAYLGGLAKLMRLMGLDVRCQWDDDDAALAEVAAVDHRILLTRDRGLLKRRNVNWARWIGRRMASPGSVLVAVGAGHLAGSDSVISMLQRDGYRVRRVQ